MRDQQSDFSTGLAKRFLLMLLFAFVYSAAEIVLFVVAVVQFGFVWFKKERNQQLLTFADSLARFIYQLIAFFTFKSNERPFPFAEWPDKNTRLD